MVVVLARPASTQEKGSRGAGDSGGAGAVEVEWRPTRRSQASCGELDVSVRSVAVWACGRRSLSDAFLYQFLWRSGGSLSHEGVRLGL